MSAWKVKFSLFLNFFVFAILLNTVGIVIKRVIDDYGVTEAMAIFLFVTSATLWVGVVWGEITGLYIGLVTFGMGSLTQTIWLWYRSRPVMRHLNDQDAGGLSLPSTSIETLRVSENP